jgi:hypothetical protein
LTIALLCLAPVIKASFVHHRLIATRPRGKRARHHECKEARCAKF